MTPRCCSFATLIAVFAWRSFAIQITPVHNSSSIRSGWGNKGKDLGAGELVSGEAEWSCDFVIVNRFEKLQKLKLSMLLVSFMHALSHLSHESSLLKG